MQIFFEYCKLMRLDKPTGFMLLFLPCAFGLAYASFFREVSFGNYLLFLYGSIVMRAAGCIVNDIIDRDIDKKVKRTMSRPIASGSISVFNAATLAVLLFIAGAIILFSLGLYAIYVGIFSVLLVLVYPFMKRLFGYPQLFLGFTFNIGIIISFVYMMQHLDLVVMLLYLGCILWTFGYDTIYGYQDKECDEKIGIKSASISSHRYSALFLLMCYAIFLLTLVFVGIFYRASILYYLVLLLVAMQMLWQVKTLNRLSASNCLIRFKSNVFLGFLVLISLLLLSITL
ncbi:MAG: 4-hydroxybenzoate octaprenyltransferase [Rickettsiales bacterium]|nr:4-hydroxybenzoate octaprenyltransferase [Rickettsiales bacterium]